MLRVIVHVNKMATLAVTLAMQTRERVNGEHIPDLEASFLLFANEDLFSRLSDQNKEIERQLHDASI